MPIYRNSPYVMTLLSCVILFLLSCQKDNDLLAVLESEDSANNVEIKDSLETGTEKEPLMVTKKASFPPTGDMYTQASKGYNQNIIRIEQDTRTGYLQFDLSDIEGTITGAYLEFTVVEDEGQGTLKVSKALPKEWNEDLTEENQLPVHDIELGQLNDSFYKGNSYTVELESAELQSEPTTLILELLDGNDFAIASKEHTSQNYPKLHITYEAPAGSEDIVIETPGAPGAQIPFYTELKAFPSAEGFGKHTTGGRGGKVIHVTNLNNSGAGSLRDAVEKHTGKRTIIFDVSGYIDMSTPLKIRKGHGDVTIAGESAPGLGIAIKGASIWIHDSNVIIRNIKIRPGEDAYNPSNLPATHKDYEPDDSIKIVAWSGTVVENIIIDNCSITWGHDGLVDMGGHSGAEVKNVSIQNNIIAENISKGYSGLISKGTSNISIIKNLISQNSDRNFAFKSNGGNAEFVNNVVYGFKRGTWLTYGVVLDVIGNQYISNPNVDRINETVRLERSEMPISDTKAFISDNYEDNNAISISTKLEPYLTNTPTSNSGLEYLSSNEVLSAIIETVGGPLKDELDYRIIQDVINRSGRPSKNVSTLGGYPKLPEEKRSSKFDSDRDGMADAWEQKYFGSLAANPQEDGNGDGYTNLEAYLFSIVEN